MSKSWTPEELAAASAAMKAEGHMSYEEFCAYLERCTEKVVVVHLADGDAITTRIHGTEQDIRDYWISRDRTVRCTASADFVR